MDETDLGVQTWREVRELAGAVMCETRDWGIKWPQWHTLTYDGQVQVDMRYDCPKHVKKMLFKHARSTFWRKAKHEYEELKEGFWLEPALALLQRKTKEEWTSRHRHVARKLVLEGGWVQKRLFDVGWLDESKKACHKEEGTEKHMIYHCPGWNEVRRQIPEACRMWEEKARTSKKEWKWQRGMMTHPPSESQWNKGAFQHEKVGV